MLNQLQATCHGPPFRYPLRLQSLRSTFVVFRDHEMPDIVIAILSLHGLREWVASPLDREAAEYRRQHVQDLSKHRTDAAKKYHAALERLAKSRDDSYPENPILIGDLVTRTPLN